MEVFFMPDKKEMDEYDYLNMNITSRSECTGMIPTVPLDEAQQEGYSDICPMPQQVGTAAQVSGTAGRKKKNVKSKT
jgi:hypothetical protein